MPRFLRHSARRLVAVLALATTAAVPALVVIAGQAPATPVAATVSPYNATWH